MQFSELSKENQVQYVKEEFIRLVSLFIDQPDSIKENLKDDTIVENVKKAISTIGKVDGCICGECIELDLDHQSVGEEFDDVLDLARQNVTTKTY
jgi:hypothetical protein